MSELVELVELHDCPTLAKRASVSACESCCGKRLLLVEHNNPALLQSVLQLSPLLPSFHSRTPAANHASRVEMAMLLLKPISPNPTAEQAQSLE